MPCLSSKFDISIGAQMNVVVAPAGSLDPATPPAIKLTAFPALVDTGASSTCISPSVAKTVGLQPIGKALMISATQSLPANVYLVDMILPFGSSGYLLRSTQVMEFDPQGVSPYQMLVGRDILCKGVLTMSFDGHFSFSI